MKFILKLSLLGYDMYFGDADGFIEEGGISFDVFGQLEELEANFQIDLFQVAPENVSIEFKLIPPINFVELFSNGNKLADGEGWLYFLPEGQWNAKELIVYSRILKPGYTDYNQVSFLLETIRPEDEGEIPEYRMTRERWPDLPSIVPESTTIPAVIGQAGKRDVDGNVTIEKGSPGYYASTQNAYFHQNAESIWNGVRQDGIDANIFRNYDATPEDEIDTPSLNNLTHPSHVALKPGTIRITWSDQSSGETGEMFDDGAGGFDSSDGGDGSINYDNGDMSLFFTPPHWPSEGGYINIEYDYGAVPVIIHKAIANRAGKVLVISELSGVETTQSLQTQTIYDALGVMVTAVFVGPPAIGEEIEEFWIGWDTAEGLEGNAKEAALFAIKHYREKVDLTRSREALSYLKLINVSTYMNEAVSPVDWLNVLTEIAPVSFTSGPSGVWIHALPYDTVEIFLPEHRFYDGDNAFMLEEEVFESKLGEKDIELEWGYSRKNDAYTASTTLKNKEAGKFYQSSQTEVIHSTNEAKRVAAYKAFMTFPAFETVWEIFTVIQKGSIVSLTHERLGWDERIAVVVNVDAGDIIKARFRLLGRGPLNKTLDSLLWGEPPDARWGDPGNWGE